MERIKESFDIAPSTNIIDVFGSSGYTLETAIADIVDNSISAGANKVFISFDINNSIDDKVIIRDNGNGMVLQDLKEAAIMANINKNIKRDIFDLGRYSLGLKSASISFCNKLYITSKVTENTANTVCIDYENIRKTKKWKGDVVEKPEYESLIDEKGTVIVWKDLKLIDKENFDRKQLNQRLYSLEMHLSHIFSDYILYKGLEIWLEKNKIEAWDPFMLDLDLVKCIDVDEIEYKNTTIRIKPYILPVYSSLPESDQKRMVGKGLIEQEGFYIFRNNRIISEGGWLNLPGMVRDNKSQYARIRVDISSELDEDFKVNFMKDSIEIPDKLEKTFIDIAKLARKESVNSYAYKKNPSLKKRRRKNKDDIPIWNVYTSDNSISLNINMEHPIIKTLTKDMEPKNIKKLFSLLSKNLPVARVQNSDVKDKDYTDTEINELIEETYNSLKAEGMDENSIIGKMNSMEPFSLDKYRHLLLTYFINKEGDK